MNSQGVEEGALRAALVATFPLQCKDGKASALMKPVVVHSNIKEGAHSGKLDGLPGGASRRPSGLVRKKSQSQQTAGLARHSDVDDGGEGMDGHVVLKGLQQSRRPMSAHSSRRKACNAGEKWCHSRRSDVTAVEQDGLNGAGCVIPPDAKPSLTKKPLMAWPLTTAGSDGVVPQCPYCNIHHNVDGPLH